MIYDGIEDGSISRWKGNHKEDTRNAILKLKKLAVSILEEYLEKSDANVLESAIEGGSNWLICPKCNDAWQSDSLKAMVICPTCDCALHNSRASSV
jgi:Zn finger protein HypA/HybF involved in hydrogenase expression